MKVRTHSLLGTFSAIVFVILFLVTQSSAQENSRGPGKVMSDEELTRETEIENLRTINRALRKPNAFEKRAVGVIQKIDCEKGIVFTIKTDVESFTLRSKDFTSLQLNAFVPISGDSSVGCDADLSAIRAVVTYKERATANDHTVGEIQSVEFVPNSFRILSDEEMNKSIAFDTNSKVTDKYERAAILKEIERELTVPEPGQQREVGFLEKIECTAKNTFFHIRTNERTLKLSSTSITAVKMRLFTRELEGMQFGCVMKPIDVPLVFIFKDAANVKDRSDGEIYSMEFVPRDFIPFMLPNPSRNHVDTARLSVPKRMRASIS